MFTYAAVAVLCLLLALTVTLALAKSFSERTAYQSLREKIGLALPFVTYELANPDPQRPRIANIVSRLNNSQLRVLFVDPATMAVQVDTRLPYFPTDKYLTLGDLNSQSSDLYSQKGITGTFKLRGENQTYLYVARGINAKSLAKGNLGGRQGSNQSNVIVVFAQPARNIKQLAQDLIDFLGPATLVALVLSLLVGYGLARSISSPIGRLAEGAGAMARGDYNQRIPVKGHDELAALTERFNQMAEEVGRAHHMERDFIANVSHDLKTPLTSIQGFSQAMLDGAIVDQQGYTEVASIINSEAQRMSRLVSELLSLTRLQNGLNSLEMQPTNLGELVSQLVLAMQPQATQAGVDLRMQRGGPDVAVLADSDRLKQAFGNLLDNALKFTPPGGTVKLEIRGTTPQAEVVVSDSGQGIPPEDLNRVMDRFYQVDKSRSSLSDGKSAGLGLAIAREIVRAHNGEIQIESEPGKGTTVHVRLPSTPIEITTPSKRARLKLLNPRASVPQETDVSA